MTGEVVAINSVRGMVGVLTEAGTYSVFELLGDQVRVGDAVRWSGDTPLGGERIYNVTQATPLDVYFQNHYVSEANLRQQFLF